MLTIRGLLDAETDPRRRRAMLAAKVEDMLNTVVRQIAFYRFETLLHEARRKGELASEQLAEIWLDVQRESLGPAFDFTEDYGVYWAYIPHFVHSPFYVYAYAFGDCLVNSLYAVYQGAEKGFAEKYLAMLKAGGTKRHKELLAPFGLVCVIDQTGPLDLSKLRPKSGGLVFEGMFTRALFQTPDMIGQHRLLAEVSRLVDAGVLRHTATEHLGRITAANLRRGHALVESGALRGKAVLEGF
jgi:hypothetical protein